MASSSSGVHSPTDPDEDEYRHTGLQVLSGARGISVGSIAANVTSVGRDSHVHNFSITNHFGTSGTGKNAHVEQILVWLRAPTFRPMYQHSLKQRMAKTGIWFLELREFEKFTAKKGTIAWFTGMPGSGKTILGAIAVEYLEKSTAVSRDVAIAFAFIRYNDRHTLRDILSSLLAQLVEGNDTACTLVHSLYSQTVAKVGVELLESDMAGALKRITKALGMVYIVLDRMDEANDQVKDGLLEALVTSGANLLILSRPLDLYTHHTPGALFVSIQAQTEDIGLYVADQVERNSRLKAILHGKPELAEKLSSRIKEKANGMFLLAKLQMELLMSSCNSVNSLFKALDKLPSGIDEMYQATLERIGAQSEEDVSIAHRTFTRLLHYFNLWNIDTRPMSLEDFQYYLAVSFEDQVFDEGDLVPIPLILSTCGGLVTVVEGDWGFFELRFIHYTTEEFMKTIQFSSIPVEPSAFLGVISMIYLDGHLDMLLALAQKDAGEVHQHFNSHPFLYHAERSWGYHAEQSQLQGQLHPYTHSFLSKHRHYPFLAKYGSSITSLPGLHIAAKHGLVDVITQKAPLSCESVGPKGYTPFHYAAKEGHFDAFCALVLRHPGVSVRTAREETFLHLAVKHSHVSFVRELFLWLESLSTEEVRHYPPDFNINARDRKGGTPLMVAIARGWDSAITRLLITHRDIQVNIRDKDGISAFMRACGHSADDFVETLISSFPDLDVDGRSNTGRTALMQACLGGKVQIVKLLLDRDPASVNDTDDMGWTPLICTVDRLGPPNRAATLRLLLEHGADPHAAPTGIFGITPFLLTASWGWAEKDRKEEAERAPLLKLFLDFDSDCIHHRDGKGRTALMLAVREGAGPAALDVLLSHPNSGAEGINARDHEGVTALFHAFQLFSKVNRERYIERKHPPWHDEFVRKRRKRDDISEALLRYHRCHDIINALFLIPSLNASQRGRRGRMALERASLSAGSHLLGLKGFGEYQELLIKDKKLQHQFEDIVDIFFATLHLIANHDGLHQYPHAFHRAALAACSVLADPITCRFLQEGWLKQTLKWTLDENCTIVLLVKASRRRCRVAVGIILAYMGLLGRRLQTGWPILSGVDVANMFCGLGCSWHTDETVAHSPLLVSPLEFLRTPL